MMAAIIGVAVVLAVFVRERNLELSEYEPKNVAESIPSTSTPQSLHGVVAQIDTSHVVTHVSEIVTVPSLQASSTTPVAPAASKEKIFWSEDQVNQVVLDSFPNLASPFVFHGTGTAFESQMSWRLRDAKRKVIGEGSFHVMSPDAGIPGPFRVEGSWKTAPKTATGTLFVFEASAKDGTPIHIVTVPVSFSTSTSL